jgi:hypothetical protein
LQEDAFKPNATEDDPAFGKAMKGGRTKGEQDRDESAGLVCADKLEQMQHAKDYSLYIEQHKLEGRDVSDLPDNAEDPTIVRSTSYVGSGVFVSQVSNPKALLEEMNLHRTSALLLRNLPPTVTRDELLRLCGESHSGFLRLRLLPPDPGLKWYRQAIATYWHNANLTKITWKIRGTVIKGAPMQILEFREFKRRIEYTDGIAGDKSVILRDIQLCKSLVEFLDAKATLWGTSPKEESEENKPDLKVAAVSADDGAQPDKVCRTLCT